MSGWLDTFLLGRPGYEFEFSRPPRAISIEEMPIAVRHRVINGTMKKSVINPSMPVVKINSNLLPIEERNALASLSLIDDTFLSFQVRDDLKVVALKVTPISTAQVILPPMSNVRLSKALVDGGFDSVITILSVDETPSPLAANLYDEGGYGEGGYSGTEHFSGGSYDDTNYAIILGTALTSLEPVYVTFTYKGWLVDMEKFSHNISGETPNYFNYDFQLTGA